MTNQKKLFVLAGIDSYVKLLTVRFIVPYLLHYPVIYNINDRYVVLLCLYGMLSRIIVA